MTAPRRSERFSFDRRSAQLYVGDVGQHDSEEIDVVRSGRNYGWRVREGSRCFDQPEDWSTAELPRTEYSHEGGRCSVTGGYRYRRPTSLPSGAPKSSPTTAAAIFALRRREPSVLLDADLAISSCGEDEAGEL